MGRVKKATGLLVPKLLDLKIVDINSCSSGWSISLDKMSEFVDCVIKHKPSLKDDSKHRWSHQLKCSLSHIEGFINLILSISNGGFKYPFDYFERDHLGTGVFPCLPRVVDGDFRLDDGRHRLAILKSLKISNFPVYLIKLERVRRKEHSSDMWNVFYDNAFDCAKSFAYSKQWYDYRRSECYKKCAAVPAIGEIPKVFSRPIPLEEAPKERFFWRRKK